MEELFTFIVTLLMVTEDLELQNTSNVNLPSILVTTVNLNPTNRKCEIDTHVIHLIKKPFETTKTNIMEPATSGLHNSILLSIMTCQFIFFLGHFTDVPRGADIKMPLGNVCTETLFVVFQFIFSYCCRNHR